MFTNQGKAFTRATYQFCMAAPKLGSQYWFSQRSSLQTLEGCCRNKTDFCEDVREQYKEMREEFMAGLEDRKYLTIEQVRNKGFQVNRRLADSSVQETPDSYIHAKKKWWAS